jgi:hypothetical protein
VHPIQHKNQQKHDCTGARCPATQLCHARSMYPAMHMDMVLERGKGNMPSSPQGRSLVLSLRRLAASHRRIVHGHEPTGSRGYARHRLPEASRRDDDDSAASRRRRFYRLVRKIAGDCDPVHLPLATHGRHQPPVARPSTVEGGDKYIAKRQIHSR